MANSYYDGDISQIAAAISPPIVTYPMQDHGDLSTRMITQRFMRRVAGYKARTEGEPNADYPSAILVAEQNQTFRDFDIMEFDRVWCEIPREWKRCETYAHTQYIVYTTEEGDPAFDSYTSTRNSVVRTKYLRTKTPDQIKVTQGYRLLILHNPDPFLLTMGSRPSGDGWMQVEDTQIKQWMGNIYAVSERFVQVFAPKQTAADETEGRWGLAT